MTYYSADQVSISNYDDGNCNIAVTTTTTTTTRNDTFN